MNKKRWARLGGKEVSLESDRLGELKRQYETENDRGAALLAAAFAEDALELGIRRCLIQDARVDALFDEGAGGSLTTFASKINMAYGLGLLPEVARRDLDLVRQVRNDFAHHPSELSFDSPSIRDRCESTALGVHVRVLESEAGRVLDSYWTPPQSVPERGCLCGWDPLRAA